MKRSDDSFIVESQAAQDNNGLLCLNGFYATNSSPQVAKHKRFGRYIGKFRSGWVLSLKSIDASRNSLKQRREKETIIVINLLSDFMAHETLEILHQKHKIAVNDEEHKAMLELHKCWRASHNSIVFVFSVNKQYSHEYSWTGNERKTETSLAVIVYQTTAWAESDQRSCRQKILLNGI